MMSQLVCINLINLFVVGCNACRFQVLIKLDSSDDVFRSHVVLPEPGDGEPPYYQLQLQTRTMQPTCASTPLVVRDLRLVMLEVTLGRKDAVSGRGVQHPIFL